MKNTLLIFFTSFIFSNTFAQTKIENKFYQHLDIQFPKNTFQLNPKNTFNKTVFSQWYYPLSYVQLDSVIGDSLNYSINFIQSDSLVKIVDPTGTVTTNQWISAGQILDPKDTMISFTPAPYLRLSDFIGYTLDSIQFSYAYVRNVNQITVGSNTYPVVDTLYIAYFMNSEIQKLSNFPSGNNFATVSWSGDSVRMPVNYVAKDMVLLTANDSTGVANVGGNFENYFNLKTITRKPSATLFMDPQNGQNMNNLIGYTFVFKSAVPSVIGNDTAIMIYQKNPSTYPSAVHRTNYFGYKYAVNISSQSWQNPNYYNTSLFAPAFSAYQPSNSWYGYIPGDAFMQDIFLDGQFHLTTTSNAGVNTISIFNNSVSVFPNPIQRNQKINLLFTSQNSSNIKIEIVNIFGQRIKLFDMKSSIGENAVDIDITDVSTGIYFLIINADGINSTKKINVVE